MITKAEQELYNTYLNKSNTTGIPIDKLDGTEDHRYIRYLGRFLSQFPQIKLDLFFEAPYILHEISEVIPLKFYTSRKAIATYTKYINQLREESPDSDYHIDFIKNSLRFIGMFCVKNNIPLSDYPTHCTGSTYSWMKAIKEHNIDIYVMFAFNDIANIILETPTDELELFLGSIIENLSVYSNRYSTSKNARGLVTEGMDRIGKVIDNNITPF